VRQRSHETNFDEVNSMVAEPAWIALPMQGAVGRKKAGGPKAAGLLDD
jgi:hypothetical protein